MKFIKCGKGLDKEMLIELYRKQMLSTEEIGKMFGITDVSVSYRLKKYGIETWSQKDRNLNLAVLAGFPDLREANKGELSDIYDDVGLKKMGERFGVSRTLIKSHLLDMGIDMMSKTDRVEKRLPKELTQEQSSLLFGSLLGDCTANTSNHITARFGEHHSLKQKEYLEWKAEIYGDFISGFFVSNKESKEGGIYKGFSIRSVQHRLFYDYYKMFYSDKKRLPKEFEELIDPLSLAVWYMDDGFIHAKYCIATSFCQDDVDEIIRVLKDKFGLEIDDKINQQGDYLPAHILHFKDSDKFFNIIKEHIPYCMRYKILRRHLFELKCLEGLRIKSDNDIPDELDEELIDDVVKYFYALGFPYPKERMADGIISSLQDNKVELVNNTIKGNTVGNSYLLSVFDNFYDVSQYGGKSAVWHFENDLEHMLRDIYGKYKKKPTENTLRSACMEHARISGFRPSIAKYICDTYGGGGDILDPCGGWGGRMLGFYCSDAKSYDCVEANFDTFRNLRKLKIILDRRLKKKSECYFGAYEDFETDKRYDLIFTSPPYFKKELYSDDKEQSCVRYEDYDSWKEGFLKPFVLKSYELLKDGGTFVVNIDDVVIDRTYYTLKDDLIKLCFGLFSSIDSLFMAYVNRYTQNPHGEPIYIFKK